MFCSLNLCVLFAKLMFSSIIYQYDYRRQSALMKRISIYQRDSLLLKV